LSDTDIRVRLESLFQEKPCELLSDKLLQRIGDKWTIRVVVILSEGSMRYNQIFKNVGGISQRMLTLTLKNLERDGLVSRTVYPTIPPRVDYELTERGKTLFVPLNALWTWADVNHEAIEKDRQAFDERAQISYEEE
jgi:DNA-binding HxlR family transcriptional regulator